MTRRAVGAVVALVVFVSAGCAGTSAEDRMASGPFQLVDHEDLYLNGVENKNRSPISFLLIRAAASPASVSEAELVNAYVEAMRGDGWRLEPYRIEDDWWVFYGERGSESVRVGPASRFVEMATVEEGYAPTKFGRLVSARNEPLVVVSIDPQP